MSSRINRTIRRNKRRRQESIIIRKRIPKERTLKTARKHAWDAFSKWRRLKGCLESTGTKEFGRCFTCGMVKKFKDLQCGHFVPGRGNAVLFDEMGTQLQDVRCNIFKGGEQLLFRQNLVKLYGEATVQALELKRNMTRKISIGEYDLIRQHYEKEYELLNAKYHT